MKNDDKSLNHEMFYLLQGFIYNANIRDMGARMFMKGLAVAVILLFIGVAFAPSINASVVKDDLVEFDVEFCGLGKKHTVQLTQQEAEEVEQLFDGIHSRLSEVETRAEAEEIFKEAVVELDKYGLLGRLSIKQAQQLMVGSNVRQNLLKRFDEMGEEYLDDETANYFCLIMGHLTTIASQGFLFRSCMRNINNLIDVVNKIDIWAAENGFNKISELLDILCFYLEEKLFMVEIFQELSMLFSIFRPFSFFRNLCAGVKIYYVDMSEDWIPSNGIVTSYGSLGYKQWDGNLWGIASGSIGGFMRRHYPAILSFNGIALTNQEFSTYFLGFAFKADLSNSYPWD